MAIIEPHEIAGLPALFEEVKALRRELELLKTGSPSDAVRAPPAVAPEGFVAPRQAEEEPETLSMSPDDIRERVGKVVGQQTGEPRAPSDHPPQP